MPAADVDTAKPMETEETELEVATNNSKPKANSEVFSPELLKLYYQRLFPYHLIYSWLCYDPSVENKQQLTNKLFSRREFSFTIMIDQEEIYIRYQSYTNQADFIKAIHQRQPVKIDIGAVFSHPPKDHKALAGKFHTEQRELVFDIDLTDYDEIRKCGCSGASICTKCWQMMTMAVKVMDQGLREDFGFQHIGWFYSGRRGVHAWVCDESARTLSNEARSAVASYFEISLGSDKNQKVGLQQPIHPMMKRAFDILEPMFVRHILPASGHGILAKEDLWKELLATLPEAGSPVKENLERKWKKTSSTPAEKWTEIKKHLEIFIGKNKGNTGKAAKNMSTADRNKIESWPMEVVFRYTYPRLDINVSKMQNHLLKSPFCVHPKTGRVCVPMQVETVDSFDPFAVPTLPQLQAELDAYEETAVEDGGSKVTHDWQKTSLKEYFEPFEKNFMEPLMKDLHKKQREEKEQQAAVVGDF